MTRRQTRLWAGVVLGTLLVGCQTFQPESDTQPLSASKVIYSETQAIGPLGGTISAGVYTLNVPQGALTEEVWISIQQDRRGEWPVTLGPEGLQFMLPVTLEFDARGEGDAQSMTVAWWNPSTGQWVDQETSYDGGLVSTQISHFSRWIIH